MGGGSTNREGPGGAAARALGNGDVDTTGDGKHLLITGGINGELGAAADARSIDGASRDPGGNRAGVLVFSASASSGYGIGPQSGARGGCAGGACSGDTHRLEVNVAGFGPNGDGSSIGGGQGAAAEFSLRSGLKVINGNGESESGCHLGTAGRCGGGLEGVGGEAKAACVGTGISSFNGGCIQALNGCATNVADRCSGRWRRVGSCVFVEGE